MENSRCPFLLCYILSSYFFYPWFMLERAELKARLLGWVLKIPTLPLQLGWKWLILRNRGSIWTEMQRMLCRSLWGGRKDTCGRRSYKLMSQCVHAAISLRQTTSTDEQTLSFPFPACSFFSFCLATSVPTDLVWINHRSDMSWGKFDHFLFPVPLGPPLECVCVCRTL